MAQINSEIGKLEEVIIHTPGSEVENMTPENAERALYSDILNPTIAEREYGKFRDVLNKVSKTYEVMDLLEEVLSHKKAKEKLINDIITLENKMELEDHLYKISNKELARQLIEGVPISRNTYSRYVSDERFSLAPLHNFFFTRDASMAFGENVLIGSMFSVVREREAMIMKCIFDYHPELMSKTIRLKPHTESQKFSIEGGDFLVPRENVFLIGNSSRTTATAIDSFIDFIANTRNDKIRMIIQELPPKPESFIHLDMVFTFLDKDFALVYEPVIYNQHDYRTTLISIENGKVTFRDIKNVMSGLKTVGIEVDTIACGGEDDLWIQEREQWHSGTNFFCFEPGKVIGYGRNQYTLEEMNNEGFEIVHSTEFLKQDFDHSKYKKLIVTIDGAELARGGGGSRCMTMPLTRKEVDW